MPEAFDAGVFEIDHVVAIQHRGATRAENLALACFYCNSKKGPNLSGYDLVTQQIHPLFNPRSDDWHEHFQWQGATLVGLSAIGRVTIHVLGINRPGRSQLREFLAEVDDFPPHWTRR